MWFISLSNSLIYFFCFGGYKIHHVLYDVWRPKSKLYVSRWGYKFWSFSIFLTFSPWKSLGIILTSSVPFDGRKLGLLVRVDFSMSTLDGWTSSLMTSVFDRLCEWPLTLFNILRIIPDQPLILWGSSVSEPHLTPCLKGFKGEVLKVVKEWNC